MKSEPSRQGKMVINSELRFEEPESDEEILMLLDSFDFAFDDFMGSSHTLPWWNSMDQDEMVWTSEASVNRKHTRANLYAVDSLVYDSTFFYVEINEYDSTENSYLILAENVFIFYDSLDKYVTDRLAYSNFKFLATDVENIGLDAEKEYLKIAITLIQYEAHSIEPSDFELGNNYEIYPYWNEAAYNIEKELNQFFHYPALYKIFYTNIVTHPNPQPAIHYSIVDNTHTQCLGYSSLDYFGSSNLRWLWSYISNKTLNYNELNQSYYGLRTFLDYKIAYFPTNYVALSVEMYATDFGKIIETYIQQGNYGCYPDDFRYTNSMKWKSAKAVSNPNAY